MPVYLINRRCILTMWTEIEADSPEDAVEFADNADGWSESNCEIEDQWIEEIRQ